MSTDLKDWWVFVTKYLPLWARWAFVASVVVGQFVHTLIVGFHMKFDVSAVPDYGWPVIGAVVVYPVAFAARIGRLLLLPPTPMDKAEEYIAIISYAMDKAQLTKIEQKFQWRAVFAKLAEDFRVGATPAPAPEMAKQIGLGMPESN